APTTGTNEAEAAALFWRGYDRYFARDYAGAGELFQQSVAKYDQDARAWFFRGLSELAQGQQDIATGSLLRGAQVQPMGRPGPEAVGRVLERIQGPQREAIQSAVRMASRSQ